MIVMEKPIAAVAPQPAATTPLSLAALLAELQALSVLLPVADRSDEEIEAAFDNLPV